MFAIVSVWLAALALAVAFGQLWLQFWRWLEGDTTPLTNKDRWVEARDSVGLFTIGAVLSCVLTIAGVF